MAELTVHQCFRCDLRFRSVAELEDHLALDHLVDVHHPTDPAPEPLRTDGTAVIAIAPGVPVEQAAELPVAIARQAGLAVSLVEVDEPGYGDATLDRYLRVCTDRVRAHGGPPVRSRRLARGEGVVPTLLDHLRSERPTLAALLTRRHSAMGDVVLGSVSRPVVAGSPVPVLLSHPGAEIADRYGRLVVGVDGSELAEEAVAAAVDLADRLGASLSITQVVDPEMLPNEVPEHGYVQRLAERWSTEDREVAFDVLHGPVRKALLGYADAEPGTIIVVGSHGRSGSRFGSLGSVSRDVVRRADLPVLVVGPAHEG